MTPQEKARELTNKFKPFLYRGLSAPKSEEVELNARHCALIAVVEIIKDYEDRMLAGYIDFNTAQGQPIIYWQEVENELKRQKQC